MFTVAGKPLRPEIVNRYLVTKLGFTSRGGEMRCAYLQLGQRNDRVFLNTACVEFARVADSVIEGSGRAGPVALRVVVDGDSVVIRDHEIPEDGGGHAESVRRIFPPDVASRIFSAPVADTLRKHLRRAARP